MSSPLQKLPVRRRIIRLLSILVAFLGPIAIYNYVTKPPKYQPKYQTIAHRFLDLEGTYVYVPDESYELLDDVITAVKSGAHYDQADIGPVERKKQLLQIFGTIDSVLTEHNFIFPPGEYTSTLGEAFGDCTLSPAEMAVALKKPHNARRAGHMTDHSGESFHLIACVPNAFLYMGVAEALGFELKPVVLPEHIFVRARLDNAHWINWDANRGRAISDEEYVRDWGVEDWQIREKIFMHPLSAGEIEGEMYSAIGFRLADERRLGALDPAIECFRKAIELNPKDFCANSSLATWLLYNPDPQPEAQAESLECAQRAIRLEPDDGPSYLTLAYAFAAAGQTAAAVAETHKAMDLDPKDTESRDRLPLIESGQTMYNIYRAERPVMFWIHYEHGWLYILIIVTATLALVVICLIRRRQVGLYPELI